MFDSTRVCALANKTSIYNTIKKGGKISKAVRGWLRYTEKNYKRKYIRFIGTISFPEPLQYLQFQFAEGTRYRETVDPDRNMNKVKFCIPIVIANTLKHIASVKNMVLVSRCFR